VARPKTNQPKQNSTTPSGSGLSIEEEAKEFFQSRREITPELPNPDTVSFFAAFALSGLIASSKYYRPDEIVEEAFKYGRLMHEYNNKNK